MARRRTRTPARSTPRIKLPRWLSTTLVVGAVLVYLYAEAEQRGWLNRLSPSPTSTEAPASTGGGANGAALKVIAWNIQNLGGSKDDDEIAFMARQLRDAEVVGVMEVITQPAGAQAVARLVDALNRTGARWDYRLSNPTSGRGTERYAWLWKPSAVRLVGDPWLDPTLDASVDREPYLARFEKGGRRVTLAVFHAVPTDKEPAQEIRQLVRLHDAYRDDHLVVCGDFNLDARHEAFAPLKNRGYAAALDGARTTLKTIRSREGEHLANPYDNCLVETAPLRLTRAQVLDYSSQFETLQEARTISDHLPIQVEVGWP